MGIDNIITGLSNFAGTITSIDVGRTVSLIIFTVIGILLCTLAITIVSFSARPRKTIFLWVCIILSIILGSRIGSWGTILFFIFLGGIIGNFIGAFMFRNEEIKNPIISILMSATCQTLLGATIIVGVILSIHVIGFTSVNNGIIDWIARAASLASIIIGLIGMYVVHRQQNNVELSV